MYIGYSMGSSSFFAMTDMRPEYNDKIVASINMAPGIYIEPSKDLFTFLLKTIKMPVILIYIQNISYVYIGMVTYYYNLYLNLCIQHTLKS